MISKFYLIFLFLILSTLSIAVPNKQLPTNGTGPWIVNVYYQNKSDAIAYKSHGDIWKHFPKEKYFVAQVPNLHKYQELFSYDFVVGINQKQMIAKEKYKFTAEQELKNNPNMKTIPGFPCERTVAETFTSMGQLEIDFPDIVEIKDIGDTWEKLNAGGQSFGEDMRVIKITNKSISGTKPKLFAMSSMHARELAPAELNTRFAEYLVNNYGTDADVTWIVDHHEVHLLLQGNPDGRKRVETGADTFKRKNQNNNHNSGSNSRGVDINRNFLFKWNQGSGSSGSATQQNYRGPSALSEFENQAIDEYVKALWGDNRGPNNNDAAPLDTTGVYIDIHSEAALILWPYGYVTGGAPAPNHSQLRTLGRKFGYFTGYRPEQSNASLGGADGASDDNVYGQLGVASYTFELSGDGDFFRPSCNFVENTIIPDNLNALIYAAKVTRTPYITASGPDIVNITLDASNVAAGTIINISGTATDLNFNSSNGTEPTQNIASVEMFIDELPWDNSSTPVLLSASDGGFNAKTEPFNGQIDTTGLSSGQHTIYLQTTDSTGTTGVVYAKYFNIVSAANLGTLTGTITDADTSQPVEMVNVLFGSQSTQTNAQGVYSFSLLPGAFDLTASKQGYTSATSDNINVIVQQTTTRNLQLQAFCGLIDDDVNSYNDIAAATSAGWTHAAAQGSDDWQVDGTSGRGSSAAFRTQNPASTSDKSLITASLDLAATSTLEFWHKYSTEATYDGGVLEISTNNGGSWIDLAPHITAGGYDSSLQSGGSNPISGQMAWHGNHNSFSLVQVNLASYAGQTAKIRWRFGSDAGVGGGYWTIDDIKLLNDPNSCAPAIQVIYKNGFE